MWEMLQKSSKFLLRDWFSEMLEIEQVKYLITLSLDFYF